MEAPYFSVVIPVYNKAPHLNRSIGSVLNQSFQNFEVIIVDDASTDTSLEEIKKFSDERIRVYQRNVPGPGGYAARNLGISNARGKWIAFLDADDEWHDQFLEEMERSLQLFPKATIAATAYKIVKDNNESELNAYYDKNNYKGRHYFNLEDFIRGPRPVCTSVIVVEKNEINRIGGFDESWNHGADTELWFRLLLEGNTGVWSPYIGAIYYKNSVNMVTDNLNQTVSPITSYIIRYLNNNKNHKYKNKLKLYSNKCNINPTIRLFNKNKLTLIYVYRNFYLKPINKVSIYMLLIAIFPAKISKKIKNKILQ